MVEIPMNSLRSRRNLSRNTLESSWLKVMTDQNQGTISAAGSIWNFNEFFIALHQFGSMHAREQLPIKWLGCHGMQGDWLNGSGVTVGYHTANDLFRFFDQPPHGLVGEELRHGVVHRGQEGGLVGILFT